jgi:hypothetical protein
MSTAAPASPTTPRAASLPAFATDAAAVEAAVVIFSWALAVLAAIVSDEPATFSFANAISAVVALVAAAAC